MKNVVLRKPNTMHFRAESDMNMIPLAYPAKDMDSETENPNCKHRLDRWELGVFLSMK
jgi:hypothetical protein